MSGETSAATEGGAATAAPSTGSMLTPAPAPIAGHGTADAMMAQALVANGHWTAEQATAALAEGNAEPDGATGVEGAEPFNQYAAIADMKSTLAAVGIDGKDAGAAEHVVKLGLARAPTPEQNAQACGESLQMLEGIYGSEKAGWMVEWARREFQHLAAANPKLVDLAERSGAGNSIALIQQLANRGMIRYNKARFGK